MPAEGSVPVNARPLKSKARGRPRISNLRKIAVLTAMAVLAGCGTGRSACEQATRDALPSGTRYEQLAVREEPGETPAMTYFVIDYIATRPDGGPVRESVHCAYMRDTGEATPHLILSEPA